MNYQIIEKYFPDLSALQTARLQKLYELYLDWNTKINVISRKDIESLYEKHVLHALSIAKVIRFKPNSKILDLGTGGGFPGIPLAIFFEDATFHLNDSIAKKIKVVDAIASDLELSNVVPICARAETLPGRYDYIISRAVAPVGQLWQLARPKISKNSFNDLPNGFLCLKGGDLSEEISTSCLTNYQIYQLCDYFDEPFFETKKILFLPVSNLQM